MTTRVTMTFNLPPFYNQDTILGLRVKVRFRLLKQRQAERGTKVAKKIQEIFPIGAKTKTNFSFFRIWLVLNYLSFEVVFIHNWKKNATLPQG